jgi:hypothetical protein
MHKDKLPEKVFFAFFVLIFLPKTQPIAQNDLLALKLEVMQCE